MTKEIGIPTAQNMRPLGRPFSDLWAHAFITSLLGSDPQGNLHSQLRGTLSYRLQKATRHYAEASHAISAQLEESAKRKIDAAGAAALPILDFSPAFDDLAGDIYVIARTIRRMESLGLADPNLVVFSSEFKSDLKQLEIIRSKSDHIDEEITADELQDGPIRPAVTIDGEFVLLGAYEFRLSRMAPLLEGLFDALAASYNGFLRPPTGQATA